MRGKMALISSLMFSLSLVFIFTRLAHVTRVSRAHHLEFNYPFYSFGFYRKKLYDFISIVVKELKPYLGEW